MGDDFMNGLQQEIGIRLVRTFDPKYDTFELPAKDGKPVVSVHLFQIMAYGTDPNTGLQKTEAECNMTQCGQLGMPLGAKWEWVRLFIEEFKNPADVRLLLSKCYMDVVTGSQTIARKIALGAMVPVLPKGGKELVQKWIKDGVVTVWPWLQAALPIIGIHPHESFRVSIYSIEPLVFSGTIRAKVLLGPWLYRPNHTAPHYEDRPEDVVVDG